MPAHDTKGLAPLKKPTKAWSKSRRVEAAIEAVLEYGYSQVKAAEFYGVSRSNLNRRIRDRRLEEAADREIQVARVQAGLQESPTIREKRRIPTTLTEFVDTYFTEWVCPDCQKHHDVPEFHEEITSALRNPDHRRVLINLPPYHSKTTVATVWNTVMDIAENPNIRTAIVSQTSTFSEAILFQIREILTNNDLYTYSRRNLIQDFGPFVPTNQGKWSNKMIYVSGRTGAEKDPTVEALGVGTQIYGKRYDKIKFDDVATLDDSRNPEQVQKLLEWIDKMALSRIGKSGQAVWAGTRVAPGDIYYHMGTRPGYVVIRYPAIIDDSTELTLWPDHFPYSQALLHRSEMRIQDFQLVYQNVDMPGTGASFTEEMVDNAKRLDLVAGQQFPRFRIIGGLDLAGGTKGSGYTAFTVLGMDMESGDRFILDSYAEKQMKAPKIKEKLFELTLGHGVQEWRVENNGLQSQIVQFNQEIVRFLAQHGVRLVPHVTGSNKWDPQFGVEAMATLFDTGMIHIPWGNEPTRRIMQPLVEELLSFPMGVTSDRVMSLWFAETGARESYGRAHLPLFSARQRVPDRIKKRRTVIDFGNREARHVPMHEQRFGSVTYTPVGLGGQESARRTVGNPGDRGPVRYVPAPSDRLPVNVDPRVWDPDTDRELPEATETGPVGDHSWEVE